MSGTLTVIMNGGGPLFSWVDNITIWEVRMSPYIGWKDWVALSNAIDAGTDFTIGGAGSHVAVISKVVQFTMTMYQLGRPVLRTFSVPAAVAHPVIVEAAIMVGQSALAFAIPMMRAFTACAPYPAAGSTIVDNICRHAWSHIGDEATMTTYGTMLKAAGLEHCARETMLAAVRGAGGSVECAETILVTWW